MSKETEIEPEQKAASPVGSTGVVGGAVRCCECQHWKKAHERIRQLYGFAKRLSVKEGRQVAIGFCYQKNTEGSGPTADHDWCEHAEKTPTVEVSRGRKD